MYDKIKRRIEQKLGETPRFSIERVAAGNLDGDRDESLISEHATSHLERQMSHMFDDIDASEAAAQPSESISEFVGLRTRRQMEKHLEERLYMDIVSPIKAFDYTVPSGSRVFGPPYDREWHEGNGIAFGARTDGKVFTIPTANGFSAAGIGFYLTTDKPVLAAITPQGTYDWNWTAFENLPFARSRGGLGIAVYANSDPQPMISRQPQLWSVSGVTTFTGQKGNGRIADAASPAFGFGTVPLAPALINMSPGSCYLVWVWCWQTAQMEKDDGFIAFLSFNMPFVTIDAGPPIVVN